MTFETEDACEQSVKQAKQKLGAKECDVKKATNKPDPRMGGRGGPGGAWAGGFAGRGGRGRGGARGRGGELLGLRYLVFEHLSVQILNLQFLNIKKIIGIVEVFF